MSLEPELEARLDEMTQDIIAQARSEAWKVFQGAPHALELDELISLAYQGLAQSRARWADYCARRGFSPEATQFYAAYCLRRIRGSMLDAMRSSDWVTRSVRGRAKLLRDAGLDQGKTEAQLSEATGLSVAQIRDTLAGMARKPVALDAEPVEIAAENQDVEAQAVVHSVLEAVEAAIKKLPRAIQLVLACCYFAGQDFVEIAELLDEREDVVRQMHAQGVALVHEAMITAVRD